MADLDQNILKKFPYLSETKLAELLAGADIHVLDEGEVFIRAGERTSKLGFVLEGLMRNSTINHKGEELTVLFAAEMEVIAAYAPLFLGTVATETSAALERTVLLVFDFQRLRQLAMTDPIVMHLYSDMMEASLVSAIQRIEDFTQKKPEQRYQRLLDTESHLSDLASSLGITAVSLSRIRRRLSRHRN
jgi:CRP-like cAMP-binding protein